MEPVLKPWLVNHMNAPGGRPRAGAEAWNEWHASPADYDRQRGCPWTTWSFPSSARSIASSSIFAVAVPLCPRTGGAENTLLSFASLTRPTGHGLLCALSPFVVVGWVCVKNLLRTTIELMRAVSRFIAHPVVGRQSWRWLTIQIGFSVWMRGFFTLAVARDLCAGTAAVYVNYLDYDVVAHAFGPRSRRALLSLRRVDRAIRYQEPS
jgi:hypothetical protein